MNNQNLRVVLIATIPLLFFVGSCTKNGNNLGADNPGIDRTSASQKPAIQVNTSNPTQQVNSTNSTATQTETPVATLANFDSARSEKLTDAAKFLAAIKVENTKAIADIQKSKAWNDHQYHFDKAWAKLEDQQLSKIRNWSDAELKSLNQSSAPIFYPFSGPDFLYMYSFFPKGSDYVMAGLEPVGTIPDIEKISTSQMDGKLQEIHKSMNDLLQLSFFRTKAMNVDLADKGVLPILFVFLAKTNNKILDVQYIGLDKDSKIQVLDESKKDSLAKTLIPGVKIAFVPEGESQPRSLYYFSVDLSDGALQKTPEFNAFVKQFPKPISYLKAASYLMHNDEFSNIRNLIVAQSSSLLQDDSGMPVKYLDQSKWDRKFYGTYTQPIDLFKTRYQSDLRNIYQSDSSIKPLDFGIGYQFQVNTSNLMLAIAKEKPQSQP